MNNYSHGTEHKETKFFNKASSNRITKDQALIKQPVKTFRQHGVEAFIPRFYANTWKNNLGNSFQADVCGRLRTNEEI